MTGILADSRNADGTYDGTKALSAISGGVLSPMDVKGIWEEVKANRDALANCEHSHHQFDELDGRPGRRKFKCRHCGGTMGLEIVTYIRGFEAAGGKASEVWDKWDGN